MKSEYKLVAHGLVTASMRSTLNNTKQKEIEIMNDNMSLSRDDINKVINDGDTLVLTNKNPDTITYDIELSGVFISMEVAPDHKVKISKS
ncbi:hypothetical protein [Vibrio metschnikovii]|uniref:hypothetical protein n=1 Tax=Vibrio metschnikovii TaxID=28172 RepID=UPI001C2F1953|nr:hypothetical protein [Vibrio metschnikovii]